MLSGFPLMSIFISEMFLDMVFIYCVSIDIGVDLDLMLITDCF